MQAGKGSDRLSELLFPVQAGPNYSQQPRAAENGRGSDSEGNDIPEAFTFLLGKVHGDQNTSTPKTVDAGAQQTQCVPVLIRRVVALSSLLSFESSAKSPAASPHSSPSNPAIGAVSEASAGISSSGSSWSWPWSWSDGASFAADKSGSVMCVDDVGVDSIPWPPSLPPLAEQ
eukprot:CAMPEP_0202453832 /NCGR_PEP_ID=MMETSP1360-20130828/11721_1 /ASSEMBLY_ACC=CAM_ASM_000848 /TAXON_ID=515479 /ORGANISM="Licmophora paradoxa, Strain CCMP2313" /LENGTH=172 /DNA_ID=CAMNT_0049073025 /DNA_START=313 /DNA_END=832 /DNA_ORIENTATION=-